MGKYNKSNTKPPKVQRKPVKVLNSDDEYDKSDKPNYTQDKYYFDDEDDFHSSRNKVLLNESAQLQNDSDLSEEEVLGIGSSSEDEEIAEYEKRLRQLNVNRFKYEKRSDDDSDEKEEDEEELGAGSSWGSKPKEYYGADFVDDRRIDFADDVIDPHVLEEQEAIAMQKRMAAQLDEADFQLESFFTKSATADGEAAADEHHVLTVEKDLSQLDEKEKLQLLNKESPELLNLIADFKLKMKELSDRYLPLYKLIKSGTLSDSSGAKYIQAKVQLLINYCVNLCFYLMLKAKRTPVHNHPVVKRLVQYRNLITEARALDEIMDEEVKDLLLKVSKGQTVQSRSAATESKRKRAIEKPAEKFKAKRLKVSCVNNGDATEQQQQTTGTTPVGGRSWGRKRAKADGNYNTSGEKQALEYYAMMKTGKRVKSSPEAPYDTDKDTRLVPTSDLAGAGDEVSADSNALPADEDEKRAITYEMAKNKGLMPKRKKEQRNPRVKHKLKYRKAKIRRRGQVREARTEMTRYAGELSGIRAGVKKSTKFKN